MMYCKACGRQLHESAVACPGCGAAQQTVPLASDGALKYILPVGRSGWSIAAGYLAFFSLLLFPAPAALLCGVMGLRDIKKNPKKIGKPRAIFGIVLGGLGTLVLTGLFATRWL